MTLRFTTADRQPPRLHVTHEGCAAGPDAYRDLPRLLRGVESGQDNAMNVQLSLDETYADIAPVRPEGAHAAFVSITRGCNNMCSFCIVPRTRCGGTADV